MYIGLGVWVTASVTLVVLFVLAGVFSANAHLLIGDFPPPRHHHMVDVDGVVPGPQPPLINPQEPPLEDVSLDSPPVAQ